MNIEDDALIAGLTKVVREADQTFQRVGGSSRHWVRDCFLPELQRQGWQLFQPAEWVANLPSAAEGEAAMKTKRANARKKAWATRRAEKGRQP